MPHPLDIDFLREAVRYDPLTGKLYWLHRPRSHFKNQQAYSAWNVMNCGKEAFATLGGQGYFRGGIKTPSGDKVQLSAHVVAFLLQEGRWPKDEVDHRNRRRTDNRWRNLREATPSMNRYNSKLRSDNSSGFKGVSPFKGKWRSMVSENGSPKHLGDYLTPEAAHEARVGYFMQQSQDLL